MSLQPHIQPYSQRSGPRHGLNMSQSSGIEETVDKTYRLPRDMDRQHRSESSRRDGLLQTYPAQSKPVDSKVVYHQPTRGSQVLLAQRTGTTAPPLAITDANIGLTRQDSVIHTSMSAATPASRDNTPQTYHNVHHNHLPHDENNFDTTRFVPFGLDYTLHMKSLVRRQSSDSMDYIEVEYLDMDVAPHLQKYVVKPYSSPWDHVKHFVRCMLD